MSATAVSLTNLTKTFGNLHQAVKSLNLDIKPGELVSLLGESGCGKTTTLRMIAGLERPNSGSILFDGVDVTDNPTEKRPVGMVFQKSLLFPHMSIAENIGFGLKMQKVAQKEIDEKVEKMLGLVQLEGYGARRVGQLSGGQEQRVSLARALVVEPDVLLLDEPLSALDANLRVQMRDLIRSIQQQIGVTTVFVTHDQAEAVEISDRIALLVDGRIEQYATPEEFYTAPESVKVARFFGTSNLLEGHADRGTFTCAFGSFPINSGLSSGDGILALRQEEISLVEGKAQGPGDVSVLVERIQYLGTKTRIWVKPGTADGRELVQLDASPSFRPQAGDTITVRFNPLRIHILPPESSVALADGGKETEGSVSTEKEKSR